MLYNNDIAARSGPRSDFHFPKCHLAESAYTNLINMIKRIVKMTFRPEAVPAFLEDFEKIKDKIRNRPGCHHLELWREVAGSNVLFTYSFWENEAALNAYRHSDLFKSVWKTTKEKFAEKAEAWSVEVVSQAVGT